MKSIKWLWILPLAILAGCGPNDMGVHSSVGRPLDTEIAILVERAEASLECCVLDVRRDKALSAHRYSFR